MIIMDIDVILIYHEIYYWYITLDIIKGIVRYNEQRKVTIYSNSDGRDQPSITHHTTLFLLLLGAEGRGRPLVPAGVHEVILLGQLVRLPRPAGPVLVLQITGLGKVQQYINKGGKNSSSID